MTVWWVTHPSPFQPYQLTGINLGPRWTSVGFVATSSFGQGSFATHSGGFDFLVTNLTDHHLYADADIKALMHALGACQRCANRAMQR
jgi:hypothetical protein